ncbi:MAG: Ig-like domain-containing protein [Armatimonadetes bacterium]|nr:Ig-like domain-containing protein [Armatimonadota bacterium]
MGVALFLLAGHVSQAAVITFQTEAGRPRIVSSSPTSGARSFPVNSPIQITFDQDMNVSTLTAANIKLVDLSTGLLHPGWTAGANTSNATRFQLKPNGNLESGQSYAIILTTGVQSATGRTMDPADPLHRSGTLYGEAWVLEFTTGTGPLSSATIKNTNIGNRMGGPSGGQIDVPINAVIRINFERAMTASTVNTSNIVLKKSGNAAPLAVAVTYDDVSLTAVITPASPLEYGTTYTLTLTGLKDVVGNDLP